MSCICRGGTEDSETKGENPQKTECAAKKGPKERESAIKISPSLDYSSDSNTQVVTADVARFLKSADSDSEAKRSEEKARKDHGNENFGSRGRYPGDFVDWDHAWPEAKRMESTLAGVRFWADVRKAVDIEFFRKNTWERVTSYAMAKKKKVRWHESVILFTAKQGKARKSVQSLYSWDVVGLPDDSLLEFDGFPGISLSCGLPNSVNGLSLEESDGNTQFSWKDQNKELGLNPSPDVATPIVGS